jgi:hypothetical protein
MRTGLGIALLAIAASGAAQDVDPLLETGTSDPLELARAVDRIGDAALLARLGEETPADVRLLAVRGAPQMHAPERALEPLARIAAGRDPDLAPAAALSASRIARALDPQALEARETLPSDLAAARTVLEALAADETARADIRRAAGMAVDAIGAAGG